MESAPLNLQCQHKIEGEGAESHSLRTTGSSDKTAAAWRDAEQGIAADVLALAEDDDDGTPDPLEGLSEEVHLAQNQRASGRPLRKPPKRGAGSAPTPPAGDVPPAESGAPAQAPIAMRYLKRIEDLVIGEVTLLDSAKPKGNRVRSKRGGLAQPPADGERGEAPAGTTSLLRGYSDAEGERLAVAILKQLLETDRRTLRNLTKVANLGADVVDNLDKYFEIKASAGEMPDVISLQYSELERSLERPPGHWFLVVVAGLEQGYDTKIRFIADPLKHLSWADHGSVSLSGVRLARALEITLPAADR